MEKQTVVEMRCIPDLIVDQAEASPDAIALICDEQQIIYTELNRRSNRLASRLRALGVGTNVRVAVCLETSVEAVVALLGVLKAGGVYVPLSPRYPAELRDFILADSDASVLLTQDWLRDLFAARSTESLRIESDWGMLAQESGENPVAPGEMESLACILYHASRDAQQIEQRGLLTRLQVMGQKLGFSREDIFFDWETPAQHDAGLDALLPLMFGGRLVLRTGIDESLSNLPRAIADENITVARLTPSELALFLKSLPECRDGAFTSLRQVVCSGEPLRRSVVERVFACLPGCELHYCYAPPEAGREVTWHQCRPDEARDVMPIGRPVQDVSVYILDKRGRLAPIGLAGEIFIGGQGLALQSADESDALRAMPAPRRPGQTLPDNLRGTHEVGRWLNDGSLELLGTSRHVWFGGSRVELAEVEQALRAHPVVSDCAVRVRETEDHVYRMVAYVALSETYALDRLRADLESMLPPLLTPRFFVPVSQLPLAPSGQVDEEALARLEVIDDVLIERWRRELRDIPEIEELVLVVGEYAEPSTSLVLSELLPEEEQPQPNRTAAVSAEAGAVEVADESESVRPAISEGRTIDAELPGTFSRMLEDAAKLAGEQGIVYVQADNSEHFQSYAELYEVARKLASGLRRLGLRPGDKVIFQLQDNRDFVSAFWGCTLCGCVPVPISIAPTYREVNSVLHKLRNAWEMLGHPIIITASGLRTPVADLAHLLDMEGLRVETVEELQHAADDGQHHEAEADDPALILLTSGSTGMPKGVVLRHRNVINRCYATSKMNDFSAEDISLNWLPLDHVGGIVMFHLRDVYLRCRQIHATTNAFLEQPLKWLDWIDRYRATITWAPNFAYALLNAQYEKIREGQWDLSSMRFILNAGEAIVPETASRFLEMLAPHGLPPTAMHPAWGMSETSSAVTYSDKFRVERGADASPFVEVGKPIPGISIRIVDGQGELLGEGQIGRLQIRGNTVTAGYYENPSLNREFFSEDGWFTTGDLGFIRDGALTITGREKDVIIINGINYYSHEIEGVAEEVSGIVSSFTAACAVRDDGSQTDKLAIFFSPVSDDPDTLAALLDGLREKIVGDIGINPSYLIPVPKEAIPKTEIGKIQRSKLRERFEAGEFNALIHQVEIQTGKADTIPDWFYQRTWLPKEPVHVTDSLANRHFLIFMDQSGVGEALAAALKSAGALPTRIERGTEFEKAGHNTYRINPRDQEHYQRLFASLADEGIKLDGILHLWAYDKVQSEISALDALRDAQRNGIYSVLFAAQASAKMGDAQQPTQFHVITKRAQPVAPGDPVAWEHGAIRGLVRTMRQELPRIGFQQIDLADEGGEQSAERILAELRGTHHDVEVAYRRGKRLIQRLSRVDMLRPAKKSMPLRHGGLYLITGGLGGIGTVLAKFLIERYSAKLILVGRTPLDEASNSETALINNFNSLKAVTDEFIYEAADVSEIEALQNIVARAEARWSQPLSGVFHLAGEGNLVEHWADFDQHSVQHETLQNFEAMFQAKVYGAWVVSQLLSSRPDAILINFSSVNGVLGGANFSAYSAANSFLEDFSIHQHRSRGGRAYCFSWTIWDNIGMSEGNPDYAMKMVRSHGYHVISKKQGFDSLLAGIYGNHEHMIVGLDGSNRNIRRYTVQRDYKTKSLYAYFTTTSEDSLPNKLKGLSVRDSFGGVSSCQFMRVAEIPLTSEGSVDIPALMTQSKADSDADRTDVAPRTETEKILASIWQDVLQVEISVNNNFFSLGGHSLLAMQVISRIRDAFQIELPLRTLFESPSVAEMAARIDLQARAAAPADEPIRPVERDRALPLSFAQQRLWFLSQLNPDSASYNIPAAVRLSGQLNVAALRQAMDEVVRRHEVLRTTFSSEQGHPVQIIHGPSPLNLTISDLSALSPDEQQAEIKRHSREEENEPFDLERGPVVRARLLRLSAEEHVLVFTVHHIASDGWSTGVMI
ncbi:MAG: SDR family NAD(P)-dependent oxidoreductase, partial [Acidobacteria bacterium]|nr:SDR family NAD(P)-dependent oxidoreductase [Acidobacteriota bacterium]